MKKIKVLIAIAALFVSLNGFGQFWYTNVSYDIGIPMGSSKDFVSTTSFRGATFNFGRMINDNLSIDGRFSWSTYYEARDFQTYTSDDGMTDISGKAFKYINNFPITTGLTYFVRTDGNFTPYFSGGLGAYKINERTDMGIYYAETKEWHFGLFPQIGLLYEINYSLSLNIFARYDYAFKTSRTTDHSFLTFGIGLYFDN